MDGFSFRWAGMIAAAAWLAAGASADGQARFGVGPVPGVGGGPGVRIGVGIGTPSYPGYPGRFDPYPGYWRQDGSGRYRPYGSDYWYERRPGYYVGTPPYLYLQSPGRYYLTTPPAPYGAFPSVRAPAYGDFKVEIRVPHPEAQVVFNEVDSGKTGRVRKFETSDLQVGREYRFTAEARWREDGREVVLRRDIAARAGESKVVEFAAPK